MDYFLPENEQKEKQRRAKAIPQVAYSVQNKSQKGRYFLDNNANIDEDNSNWADNLATKQDVENVRPYKSYSVLLSSENDTPFVNVLLENSLDFDITYQTYAPGTYGVISSINWPPKTVFLIQEQYLGQKMVVRQSFANSALIEITLNSAATPGQLNNTFFEIRVYN